MKNKNIEAKPYIVSGDIEPLMQKWAQNRGFVLPDERFFGSLRAGLIQRMGTMFENFEYIPSEQMKLGIEKASQTAQKDGLTPVSLDPVYPMRFNLYVTRGVDEKLENKGLTARAGFPNISTQIRALKASGLDRVALIDDVLYSGGVVLDLTEQLSQQSIQVVRVAAAIAVDEGIDKLKQQNIELDAMREYPEGVVDEVCERDFYPGVPFSGRSMIPSSGPIGNIVKDNIGVPYILPFGKPNAWASVPKEEEKGFSDFFLEQSAELYEEIDRLSGRSVKGEDLDRDFAKKTYGRYAPTRDNFWTDRSVALRLRNNLLFGKDYDYLTEIKYRSEPKSDTPWSSRYVGDDGEWQIRED